MNKLNYKKYKIKEYLNQALQIMKETDEGAGFYYAFLKCRLDELNASYDISIIAEHIAR